MNDTTASSHRAIQTHIDRYIRTGSRARSLAERRVEREICYADHLKAIVEQAPKRGRSSSERI